MYMKYSSNYRVFLFILFVQNDCGSCIFVSALLQAGCHHWLLCLVGVEKSQGELSNFSNIEKGSKTPHDVLIWIQLLYKCLLCCYVRIKKEWDLVLINILTLIACNAIVVWLLAPSRSYGNTFQFDLQNTVQKLPNNIFEKSYPFREFDLQKRIQSFVYKAAELCMIGCIAGAFQGASSNLSRSKKEGRYLLVCFFNFCLVIEYLLH